MNAFGDDLSLRLPTQQFPQAGFEVLRRVTRDVHPGIDDVDARHLRGSHPKDCFERCGVIAGRLVHHHGESMLLA
jgi:hypothetical protein